VNRRIGEPPPATWLEALTPVLLGLLGGVVIGALALEVWTWIGWALHR
jgi:hypothetical protein